MFMFCAKFDIINVVPRVFAAYDAQNVLDLPPGRISGFLNLPQNSGNFGFRHIHK